MKKFTLNGKEYIAKEFDFNMICDLEDIGISIEQAGDKPMSLVRAYISFCIDGNKEKAGKEMQEHLVNGGNFAEIMGVMSEMMDKSDFFRAIQ